MAKSIETVEKIDDMDNLIELTGLVSEHYGQIKEMISLIDVIEKSGILTIIKAVLSDPDAILSVVSNEMLRESNVRLLRNSSSLVSLLSHINSDKLDSISRSLTESINGLGETPKAENIGILTIMQMMKDPDIAEGIRLMFGVLKGIGSAGKK
ncbi:MAG: DUF1641 domain-containing protein [Thermoplasmatales archaeon]|nr:DUF1641 domain-containing protein [Thermoplasmatales archaeon]MCW6170906.1 DUF1641 domain-containing protein [Thermoplasmatales archaeon]